MAVNKRGRFMQHVSLRGTLTYIPDHIYGMMLWYGSNSEGLLPEYGMALKSTSVSELFNYYWSNSCERF